MFIFSEAGEGQGLAVVDFDQLVEADDLGAQADAGVEVTELELAPLGLVLAKQLEKNGEARAAEIVDALEVQQKLLRPVLGRNDRELGTQLAAAAGPCKSLEMISMTTTSLTRDVRRC